MRYGLARGAATCLVAGLLLIFAAGNARTAGIEREWKGAATTMHDLVSEGYEIKAVTYQLEPGILAAGGVRTRMVVARYILQKGPSVYMCDEREKYENADQPEQLTEVLLGCMQLVVPY